LMASLAIARVMVVTCLITVYEPNTATWAIELNGVLLLVSALVLGSFSADSEVKKIQPKIASMNSIEITIGSTTHS